ncbi:MAG: hypothetical protein ACKO5F_00440 [Synechococcus sp.]
MLSSMQAKVKSHQAPRGVMTSLRSPAGASAADERAALSRRIARLEAEGRLAAQQGDLAAAARCVLELLNCERRAGHSGPQVLQLIKPRS